MFHPSGPRALGEVGGGVEGRAAHPQGRDVQRDHRADGGHGSLHASHGAARHTPEIMSLRRTHRYRQERLHHRESLFCAFSFFEIIRDL